MDQNEPLDTFLAARLCEFEEWLLRSSWGGKEHDCVNLFTHGFLFPRIGPDEPIRDFTQVGIEVGVPQPGHIGIKAACRKDLVIWREPREVAWDIRTWRPITPPMAIVEWKTHRRSIQPVLSADDIRWLTAYSLHYAEFTGYAVTVDLVSEVRRVASALIRSGKVTEDFHRMT